MTSHTQHEQKALLTEFTSGLCKHVALGWLPLPYCLGLNRRPSTDETARVPIATASIIVLSMTTKPIAAQGTKILVYKIII